MIFIKKFVAIFIVFFIFLSLVGCIVSIPVIIDHFDGIITSRKIDKHLYPHDSVTYQSYARSRNILICDFIHLLVHLFIFVMSLIFLLKIDGYNFIRYTYEEYKATMDKKKSEKQEKKKQKLQQKLIDLDKTE